MKGTFFLVIAPTGSGKSTLLKHVMEAHPDLLVPPSYTTRAPRPEAIENKHYSFTNKEEFMQMVERGEFLEWAEYSGNYYGTLKSSVLDSLAAGKVLITEMEVQGVRQVKKLLPADEVVTVYIDAGPWEELKKRVLARAPMTEEDLEKRRLRYEDEAAFKNEADVIIKNYAGEAEEAKAAFLALIENALNAS